MEQLHITPSFLSPVVTKQSYNSLFESDDHPSIEFELSDFYLLESHGFRICTLCHDYDCMHIIYFDVWFSLTVVCEALVQCFADICGVCSMQGQFHLAAVAGF